MNVCKSVIAVCKFQVNVLNFFPLYNKKRSSTIILYTGQLNFQPSFQFITFLNIKREKKKKVKRTIEQFLNLKIKSRKFPPLLYRPQLHSTSYRFLARAIRRAHDARWNGRDSGRICYSRIRSGSMGKNVLTHLRSRFAVRPTFCTRDAAICCQDSPRDYTLHPSCFVRRRSFVSRVQRVEVVCWLRYYIAKQYITLYIKSDEADVLPRAS